MPARRAMRFITALSTNLRAVAGSLPGVPSRARSSAGRLQQPLGDGGDPVHRVQRVHRARQGPYPVRIEHVRPGGGVGGTAGGAARGRAQHADPEAVRVQQRRAVVAGPHPGTDPVQQQVDAYGSPARSSTAASARSGPPPARRADGVRHRPRRRCTPGGRPARCGRPRDRAGSVRTPSSGVSYSSSAAVAATTRKRPGPDRTWRWIATRPASGRAARTGRPSALSAAAVTRLRRWAAS